MSTIQSNELSRRETQFFFVPLPIRLQLFKRQIALSNEYIRISIRETNSVMQWIEIYSVDSIIHPLSNWDQHCIPSNPTLPNKFSYKFRKRENGTRKAKKGRMTQPRHFAFYECLDLESWHLASRTKGCELQRLGDFSFVGAKWYRRLYFCLG